MLWRMNPNMRIVIAVVAISFSAEAFGQLNSSDPSNAVHISGRIVAKTGVPIPSQTVTFRKVKGTSFRGWTVGTDEKGMFAFDSERNAAYQIYMQQLGGEIGTIEIVEGNEVEMGDIVLDYSPQGEQIVHLAGPIKIKDLPSAPHPGENPEQISKGTFIAAIYIACAAVPGKSCDGGPVHIVLGDGTEVQPPVEKDQVGNSDALVSQDGRAAAWLVDYDNCCTSYPLSLKLIVYKPGKPVCRFDGDGRGIFGWYFAAGGKQVAFHQDFPHGNPVPHYELRDVETCRLLDEFDDDSKKVPSWVEGFGADSGA
jgi:hypothetical protein